MRRYSTVTKASEIGCCLAIVLAAVCASGQEMPSRSGPVFLEPTTTRLLDPQSDPEIPELTHPWRPPAIDSPRPEPQVQIKPYGSLWANMLFASERTNPGAFTLWVFSPQVHGEPAVEIDARRSRVGIEIVGPDIQAGATDYSSQGRVEVDFFGQFLTENRAGARLRHAYWEASSEEWRFLIGQTWDVISPLWPGTLNFSVGWTAGNIGFRRAQFRVERTSQLQDNTLLLLQVSLNQDIVDDFPTDPGVRRESASFPVIMARTAVSCPLAAFTDRSMIVGFSGHYGQTGFDFLAPGPPPQNLPPRDDARFDTWSLNLDAEVPLTTDLTLRGEFFHGANLSPFFGGIGQGVCPCARSSIHATGGWFEIVKVWSPDWETHVGFGIDDPANGDFLLGRSLNQFLFGNLILHLTQRLSTGMEVSWWRTLYQEQRQGQIPNALLTPTTPGEAITLEWMVRYDF